MMHTEPFRDAFAGPLDLPWEDPPGDRTRLRAWLRGCATLAFCLGLVIPWLPLPEPRHAPVPTVAPAPVQISLEQPRRIPPPPPPAPLPPAPKQTAPASAPAVAQPHPQPAPKADPAPAPAPTAADARAAAASAGLLAASSALQGLRGAVDTRALASRGQATGVGTAASVDRALLTSSHGTRSAGLNEGALSRATGGVELAGRATTRVGVPGGTGSAAGGSGGDSTATGAGTGTGSSGSGAGTGTGQRSIEEIRRVFDANKGAIFAIYHRALRADPGLRGQVVLELVIEPGGAVTDIRVVSSELPDPDLLDRLMGRVRMFDFGARDVGRTRISYPVHFLPG
jgi:outer membrane biosynthesis protein TonB